MAVIDVAAKVRKKAKEQEQRKSVAAPVSQPYRMNVSQYQRGPSGVTYEDELQAAREAAAKETIIKKAVAPPLPETTPEQMQAASQLGTLTPEQQNLDVVKREGAVGEAVSGTAALAGGAAGLKIGAAGGLALGGPIGAAIGGIGGMLIGGVASFYSKVSYSERQDVKQAFAVYTKSSSNMNWIINQVNTGKISPMQAGEMWDEELANFYSAERNIKKDTSTSLQRFLSGGADEAAKIEAFRRRLPQLNQLMQQALLLPNPNNLIPEETIVQNG